MPEPSPGAGRPAVSTAAAPSLRLFGDLGSWTVGQPLSAGEGGVVVQVELAALDQLLVVLGGDGPRGLIAVLRRATPVRDGTGFRLELPGFSAAWLRTQLPLSHQASYRVSRALQDSGLLVTTSLPGVRGAAGAQRAVLTGLVGMGGGADLVPTRRGRRGSVVPAESPESTSAAQLGPVLRFLPNPDSADWRVGLATQQPQHDGETARVDTTSRRGAPAGGTTSAAGDVSPAGPTPGLPPRSPADRGDRLAEQLRLVLAARRIEARRVTTWLRLPAENTEAVSLSRWLADVLTARPADPAGVPGDLWSVFGPLRAAGVVVPDGVDGDDLWKRLVVGVCAGLDADVADWREWITAALASPALAGETATLQAVRDVLDADRRFEHGFEPVDASRGTQPRTGTGGIGEATAAGPLGLPRLGEVLSAVVSTPSELESDGMTAPPTMVTAGPVRTGSSLVLTDEPADEVLERAVAASPFYRRLGLTKVASRPHLRAAAVAEYLEKHPDS